MGGVEITPEGWGVSGQLRADEEERTAHTCSVLLSPPRPPTDAVDAVRMKIKIPFSLPGTAPPIV
jgi:hypothetical protein